MEVGHPKIRREGKVATGSNLCLYCTGGGAWVESALATKELQHGKLLMKVSDIDRS